SRPAPRPTCGPALLLVVGQRPPRHAASWLVQTASVHGLGACRAVILTDPSPFPRPKLIAVSAASGPIRRDEAHSGSRFTPSEAQTHRRYLSPCPGCRSAAGSSHGGPAPVPQRVGPLEVQKVG